MITSYKVIWKKSFGGRKGMVLTLLHFFPDLFFLNQILFILFHQPILRTVMILYGQNTSEIFLFQSVDKLKDPEV